MGLTPLQLIKSLDGGRLIQQHPSCVPRPWEVLSKYLLSNDYSQFSSQNTFSPLQPPSPCLSSSTGHRWFKCCSPHEDWKSSQTDVLFIAPQPGITKHLHLLPIRGETDCSFMHCMWLDIFLFEISLKFSKCIIESHSPTSLTIIENVT